MLCFSECRVFYDKAAAKVVKNKLLRAESGKSFAKNAIFASETTITVEWMSKRSMCLP